VRGFFSIAIALLITHASKAADRDLIGYTALAARPGALLANGANIPVAQVEVFFTGTTSYAPDPALTQFAGKTLTLRSGPSGVSSHAVQVASLFYGTTSSPAPNVTDVSVYSAQSFIDTVLRSGRVARAPAGAGASVINNSWIANFPDDAQNLDVLHRLDDLINRDNVLVFAAVSNNAADPFPKLLASSFNAVTVGSLTGSAGPVTYDAPGPRIKPDIVVNTGITSNSSADAAGSGALLLSEAKARNLRNAGELAIKAILMAGATRNAAWHRGRATGADNATAPLDFQQGAGQLRVDHSFDILTAGQQPANTFITADGGWDYARTPRSANTATYLLHLDQTLPSWSAFLTWNRTIAGLQPDGHYSTAATTPDFDLSLYLIRRGAHRLVARSDSPFDNVESLTLTNLAPGNYQLVVNTDIRSYYSLAWFADQVSAAPGAALSTSSANLSSSEVFAQAPEPSTLFLIIPALLQRRRRLPSRMNVRRP
jgi:hypothetical protein